MYYIPSRSWSLWRICDVLCNMLAYWELKGLGIVCRHPMNELNPLRYESEVEWRHGEYFTEACPNLAKSGKLVTRINQDLERFSLLGSW